MVRCKGRTLEECFENAAFAMFDLVSDTSLVSNDVKIDISVSGDDHESRLYAMLSELLFVLDSESLLLSEFSVSFLGNTVRCEAFGEHIDVNKHKLRTEIKAVTYHMMDVDPEVPSLTVIFDV
jgi:Uncharacterized conserved protein